LVTYATDEIESSRKNIELKKKERKKEKKRGSKTNGEKSKLLIRKVFEDRQLWHDQR